MSNAVDTVIALVALVARIKGELSYWSQNVTELDADLHDSTVELSSPDTLAMGDDYMAELRSYYDGVACELRDALNERDYWRGLLVKTLASIAHAIPPAPRA